MVYQKIQKMKYLVKLQVSQLYLHNIVVIFASNVRSSGNFAQK